MKQAIVPLLCCLALTPLAGAAAPLPQLSQLTARHQDALVRVLSHDGRVLSSGFFIATVGYAIGAVPGARVGDGVVIELLTGARRRGVVARVDAGSALVLVGVSAAHDDELFQALPLESGRDEAGTSRAQPDGWLVALCHDERGRVMPAAGQMRERAADGSWLLDLPCGAGAPVLSGDRVIGVTVRSRGVTASTGVSIERVLALSRGLLPKQPTELLPPPAPGAKLPEVALSEGSPSGAASQGAAPPAAPRAAR